MGPVGQTRSAGPWSHSHSVQGRGEGAEDRTLVRIYRWKGSGWAHRRFWGIGLLSATYDILTVDRKILEPHGHSARKGCVWLSLEMASALSKGLIFWPGLWFPYLSGGHLSSSPAWMSCRLVRVGTQGTHTVENLSINDKPVLMAVAQGFSGVGMALPSAGLHGIL